MVNIPRVPDGGIAVPVDLDVQQDNLPNVGCSTAVMSNDNAYLTNRLVGGRPALCVRFYNEAGGVAGSGYENCITSEGEVASIDKDGNALSGASNEEGKERIVSLVAQAYDCYVQRQSVNELAQYLISNADTISPPALSALMWKYQPYFKDWRFLPVDIDENKGFQPSVSYVTVGTKMVDDGIIVEPFEVTEEGLRLCFDFESEAKKPYGDGGRMCLKENGVLVLDNPTNIVPLSSDTDKTRAVQNMGMAIAAYFSVPSDFAVSAIESAREMTVPEEVVPEQESIEGVGFVDQMIKINLERAENCRNSWVGCLLWE